MKKDTMHPSHHSYFEQQPTDDMDEDLRIEEDNMEVWEAMFDLGAEDASFDPEEDW